MVSTRVVRSPLESAGASPDFAWFEHSPIRDRMLYRSNMFTAMPPAVEWLADRLRTCPPLPPEVR